MGDERKTAVPQVARDQTQAAHASSSPRHNIRATCGLMRRISGSTDLAARNGRARGNRVLVTYPTNPATSPRSAA